MKLIINLNIKIIKNPYKFRIKCITIFLKNKLFPNIFFLMSSNTSFPTQVHILYSSILTSPVVLYTSLIQSKLGCSSKYYLWKFWCSFHLIFGRFSYNPNHYREVILWGYKSVLVLLNTCHFGSELECWFYV